MGEPKNTSTTTAWDAGGFWDAISECQELAAELRYIDLAVAWLKDPLRTVGHEETYGPVETVTVTLGWTYPVRISIQQPAVFATQAWADDLNQTLQGFVDEGASWGRAEFSGYGSKVADAALPSAATFEYLAERLSEQVGDGLVTTIPSDLSASLNLGIEEFYGSTAESFRTGFVELFDEARENQIWVAKASGVIAAASAGIVKQAQQSLMNLVTTGRDALKSQLLARPGQHSGVAELATILMLASTAADILGLFELPEAVEDALGVTAQMITWAQAGVEQGESRKITSTTAEDITTNLYQETTEVMTRYDTRWAALQSDRVAVLAAAIAAMPRDKPFFAPRPALADGTTPDDFYYSNSPRHDG